MTIDELVKEASRLDPNLRITVQDSTSYETGKAPMREVVAGVGSKTEGEGSLEEIVIEMDSGGRGQQVRRVNPGRTTLFWQADPLIRALQSGKSKAPDVVDVLRK